MFEQQRETKPMINLLPERVKPIPVDDWNPDLTDLIFRYTKNAIILPVSDFYGNKSDPELDVFVMSKKKAYNKDEMRDHICKYLNYFVKFYDPDNEVLSIYYRLKVLIDHEPMYRTGMFVYDLKTYLMSQSILHKITLMVEDNYIFDLKYKNVANPALQYTNRHAKILMAMSMVMKIIIPICTHYVYMKNLDANTFLLNIFNHILNLSPEVDMFSKFYDTATTNVKQTQRVHSKLWDKQDIRGNNMTTHASYCVDTIILNIMPKYVFKDNCISFNFSSINKNTGYQITDIEFEYAFTSFSSSNRDEDYNSDYDKLLYNNIIKELSTVSGMVRVNPF